jgi:hypothetical protein
VTDPTDAQDERHEQFLPEPVPPPDIRLLHPDTPEYRVLLAGERYGVALPCQPGCTELPASSRFRPRWLYEDR